MRRALVALALLLACLAPPAAAAPPAVRAPAYLVLGSFDGAVLAQRRADERRPMASITKLMTVLVALQRSSLDEVVTIPPEVARIGEATISLRAGERISVRDLAVGTLVPSANDAATALALHAGGSVSRFVALMNAHARVLGLRHTRYLNPHGLDQVGHYSSARDIVALFTVALRSPFMRFWLNRREARIAGDRTLESTDRLIGRFPQLVGGKTGHTRGAGWSQVATAKAGTVSVTAVVLGEQTEEQRDRDLAALLRFGLAQYRSVRAIDVSRSYAHVRTGYGLPDVRLVPPATVVRVVRAGRPLVERIVAPTDVPLPVRAGQRLGEVHVYSGARLVASSPLLADRTVERPGTGERLRWYARRSVDHLIGLVF